MDLGGARLVLARRRVAGIDASYSRRVQMASEFRTLASLHHPHIVSVLAYGFDENRQPYYAMELLEAGRTIPVAGARASLIERCRLLRRCCKP